MTFFLKGFRQKITFGRDPDPDEPLKWIPHVNPFRYATDAAYPTEGLRKAGLMA